MCARTTSSSSSSTRAARTVSPEPDTTRGVDPATAAPAGWDEPVAGRARAFPLRNVETSGAAGKLTHLNYAFSNVTQDGKCATGDSYADWDKAFTAADSAADGHS